jgi:hypothetical protein
VTREVRRFHVDQVPIASRATSSASPLDPVEARLRVDHLAPARRRVETFEQLRGVIAESAREVGVELTAAALLRHGSRAGDPSPVVVDLDDVREGDDPSRQRDVGSLDPVRDALAVPALIGLPQRVAHGGRQTDPARELSLKRGVGIEPVVHLRPTAQRELRDPPQASEAGLARAQPAQQDQDPPGRLGVGLVGVGLDADVVSEPHRLLVRIGVAVHAVEQTRVVRRDPVVDCGANAIRQAQRQPRAPDRVLHRQPAAEVGGERQRSHQLGDPDTRGVLHRPLHKGSLMAPPCTLCRVRWLIGGPGEMIGDDGGPGPGRPAAWG